MISDEQQDQAALYALGLLDADEAETFEHAMAADPELGLLAAELRETAASLAFAAAPEEIAPPAGLRARLLAEVGRKEPVVLVGGGKASSGWMNWVPWAVAAAAAVISILTSVDRHRWYDDAMRLRAVQTRERATRQQVTPIMQLTVCQLEPTPDGPDRPRVAIVWDPARHEGKLVITQLKPPSNGHDYQLWAVEEGHPDPVSAGLVHVDAEGRAQAGFRPVDAGRENVAAFALSLEPAGGSEKARGPILLLGKF